MSPTVAVDLRALVPEPTGIGVYTLEMLRALSARDEYRYLGVAHREPRGARELASRGVTLEHQPAPLGVLWQQLRLPRRLAAADVDIFWSPLQTLPRACPVPAVVTVHDLTVLLMPDAHRTKVRWSQVPFLEASMARARRIVAVSEATARDLRFQFPEALRSGVSGGGDKVRVVLEGVSPDFRPAEAEEREAIRRELGCPGGYLLYAGTIEPRKNLEAVLEAWLALRASDGGVLPLVVAGGYGWRSQPLMKRLERVRRAIEAEGAGPGGGPAIHVLGRVDQGRLLRLFRAATLFVFPSYYEGFGLPVAEAMASGVPVVTSDRSSLPEVVGDAGLTVRPEDPSLLAGAIRRLLDDPALRRELAERGLERAKRFRWERAAEEMEEVFGEALE